MWAKRSHMAVDGSVLNGTGHLFRAAVTFAVSYDFWHDFAEKSVHNVLGGDLPK